MSFISVGTETLARAAGALRGIGDRMVASGAAAGQVTATVVAPGADLVSERVAACLRGQAASYNGINNQSATNFNEFVAAMRHSADGYSAAEAENAKRLDARARALAASRKEYSDSEDDDAEQPG